MDKTIKAALITGILGVMGTVAAAFLGTNAGKVAEKKVIQNEINESFGDVIYFIGDHPCFCNFIRF